MTPPQSKITLRALDIVLTTLITIVLGLTSWNLSQTVKHGEEIAAMRSNRFTSDDGLEVWKGLAEIQAAIADNELSAWQEIAKIRASVASLPTEVPPQWFLDEVRGLSEQVARVNERLTQIERNLP